MPLWLAIIGRKFKQVLSRFSGNTLAFLDKHEMGGYRVFRFFT